MEGDPANLAKRLSSCGAPNAAAQIASHSAADGLSGAYTKRMAGDVDVIMAEAGGILKVIRELKALEPEERVTVGLQIVQKLSDTETRPAILGVLAGEKHAVSEAARNALTAAEDGAKALELIPAPWKERLSPLILEPGLQVESLVMCQQFDAARAVLAALPHLKADDEMLLRYARAAVSFDSWYSTVRPSPTSTPAWPSTSASPRGTASPRNGNVDSNNPSLRGRGASLHVTSVLRTDAEWNKATREKHSYRTAPNAAIVRHILSLASSRTAAIGMAHSVASELLHTQVNLPLEQLRGDYSEMEREVEACDIAVRILDGARQDLDALPDVDMGGLLVEEVKLLHRKAQLLETLLGRLVPVCMGDLAGKTMVAALVERLVGEELYPLAAYIAKMWQLPEMGHVYEAWAFALIGVNQYEEAGRILANCFHLSMDPATGEPSEAGEEDAGRALAQRYVGMLMNQRPMNVAGLGRLVKRREELALGEAEASLDAAGFLQILREPDKLPTAHQAAFESMPESQMAGHRYDLAQKLLQSYCPDQLLEFMFRHHQAAAACQLLFPPQKATEGGVKSQPSVSRYGDLDSLLALSVEHGELRTLLRVLAGGGEKGRACLLQLCSRFQVAAEGSGCDNPEVAAEGSGCDNPEVDLKGRGDSLLGRLPTQELYQFLYRSFLSLQKQGDAGMVSLKLSRQSETISSAIVQLENAVLHLQDALATQQRSPGKAQPRAGAAFMTASQLASILTRASLQIRILQSHLRGQTATPAAPRALPPSERETLEGLWLAPEVEGGTRRASGESQGDAAARRDVQARRLQVAKQLLAEEFDLAFQVIHTFGLSASQAYTAAAKDLAAAGQLPGILALLENVRGTSRDQDIDQVLAAAATNYRESETQSGSSWAGFLTHRPPKPAVETLLAKMHSSHSQVALLLQLGRLHEASRLAVKSGNRQTVRLVLEESKRAQADMVIAECQAFLP